MQWKGRGGVAEERGGRGWGEQGRGVRRAGGGGAQEQQERQREAQGQEVGR